MPWDPDSRDSISIIRFLQSISESLSLHACPMSCICNCSIPAILQRTNGNFICIPDNMGKEHRPALILHNGICCWVGGTEQIGVSYMMVILVMYRNNYLSLGFPVLSEAGGWLKEYFPNMGTTDHICFPYFSVESRYVSVSQCDAVRKCDVCGRNNFAYVSPPHLRYDSDKRRPMKGLDHTLYYRR